MTHKPSSGDKDIVMGVLYPDGMPIFEWGHEETPTQEEVKELAQQIRTALYNELKDKLTKGKVTVFVHGGTGLMDDDPLMSILFKLRPRLINEEPRDRVKAVENAHEEILGVIKQVMGGE